MKNRYFFWTVFLLSSCIFLSFSSATSDYADVDRRRVADLIEGDKPVTWVFTGNSITQGAKHTHGMRGYPEIFAERIRFEMGRSRDFVVNTAVSGNTTRSILSDFDRRIAQLRPQVVLLMIGTNDAARDRNVSVEEFRENLKTLIIKIRSINAIPIVLSPNPILIEKAPERANLIEYVKVINDVVRKEHVILVDNYSNWNNELQSKYKYEVSRFLLNDPLHPNGLGHKEIAFKLFKELSIFNPTDPSCGGPYYEGEH